MHKKPYCSCSLCGLQLEPDNENASANLKFLLEEHESGALPPQATPLFHSNMPTLTSLGTGLSLNMGGDAPPHTLMQFTPHHSDSVNVANDAEYDPNSLALESVFFNDIATTNTERVVAPLSSRVTSSANEDISAPVRLQQYNYSDSQVQSSSLLSQYNHSDSQEQAPSLLPHAQGVESSVSATRDDTGHGRSTNSQIGRNSISVGPSTAVSSTVASSAASSSISSSAESSPPVVYTTYNSLPAGNIPPLHQLQQFNVAQPPHAPPLDGAHVNGYVPGTRRLSVDTATSGDDDANQFFDGVAVWKKRYVHVHACVAAFKCLSSKCVL
jgi:hypothetical protein